MLQDKTVEPITVYTTTWCPDCRHATFFLKERGVSYREVNIEEDESGEEIVIKANNGKRKVPTFDVGGRYFACSPFDAEQLAEELKIPLNP
jgi:mycoredoxin